MDSAARPHGRPIVEMARILVEAGATELSACRAAIVIAQDGSYAEASAELVLSDDADTDFLKRDEVFHPEMLISRDYGGGGNRTRALCLPEIALSSENASGSSDDEPSPPLAVGPLRLLSGVEFVLATGGTEV